LLGTAYATAWRRPLIVSSEVQQVNQLGR
jgi:hypothetical protein